MVDRGRGRGGQGRGCRGGRGGGPGRGGGGANRGGNACYEFRNSGACKKTNCPYIHEQNGQRKRVAESEEQQQARGNYNDFKKYLGNSYTPSDTHVMRQVWERASAILNEGDRDWIQQLPKDLAENEEKYNGLAHMKAIVLRKAKSYDQDDYIETAKAFLDVITDSSLLDCLAVDTYVDAIYIFISGSKGKRAYPFLQHLCETLVAA
jgi:hypothetical protein